MGSSWRCGLQGNFELVKDLNPIFKGWTEENDLGKSRGEDLGKEQKKKKMQSGKSWGKLY